VTQRQERAGWVPLAPSGARSRLVLLGASNLTRSLPYVLQLAESGLGGPLQVLAAIGHGRSYGADSRVLLRVLPGILQCGLWRDLDSQSALPTTALVTDIGNDLVYGFAPAEVMRWLEECLDRLAARGARTTITLLPVCNLEKISVFRYRAMLSVLYPRCRIPLSVMRERAIELNELLREATARRALTTIEHQPDWYGLDPVHIRIRAWRDAWPMILHSWRGENSAFSLRKHSFSRALYLYSRRPESMCVLGFERRASQPAARLRSGTTIAFY